MGLSIGGLITRHQAQDIAVIYLRRSKSLGADAGNTPAGQRAQLIGRAQAIGVGIDPNVPCLIFK